MKYVDIERICLSIPEYEGEYMGTWARDARHGFGIMKWETGY
jgi:hypothetical protein